MNLPNIKFPSVVSQMGLIYYITNLPQMGFFISNTRLKLAKNQTRTKQHPGDERLLSENYTLPSFMWSSRTSMIYSKRCAKYNCIFQWDLWLITMKMRLTMRNWSHGYDINRTRIMCLRFSCAISNIWSWIHGKVSNTELKKWCL